MEWATCINISDPLWVEYTSTWDFTSSTAALHTREVRAGCFDPEVFVNCLQSKQLTSSWQRLLGKNVLLSPPSCVKLQYCSLNLMLIQERQLNQIIEYTWLNQSGDPILSPHLMEYLHSEMHSSTPYVFAFGYINYYERREVQISNAMQNLCHS